MFVPECACTGTEEECPIGECECEGQLRVKQDCTEARLSHIPIPNKEFVFDIISIRGFALGMEHMKPRTVMMGGSCMSTMPLITTPGYGCVVPMMEDAPGPSTLAAMLRRVV